MEWPTVSSQLARRIPMLIQQGHCTMASRLLVFYGERTAGMSGHKSTPQLCFIKGMALKPILASGQRAEKERGG